MELLLMSLIFYSRWSRVDFPIFGRLGDKRAPSVTEVARDLWLNDHFVMWHDVMHQRDSVHHRNASETAYLSLAGQTHDKLLFVVRGALYYFVLLLWWITWTANPQQQSVIPHRRSGRFHLPAAPKIIYQEETSQTTTCSLKQEAAELSNRKSALALIFN